MALTQDQVKFRELYAKTCNVTKAAEALGRPRQWGYNQLKKPYMADLKGLADKPILYQPTAEDPARLKIQSITDIKKIWEDMIFGVMKHTKTITDAEGNSYEVEEEYPPSVKAKITEMYARVFGAFIEKVEVKSEHTERRVLVVVPEPMALPSPETKVLSSSNDEYLECSKCKEYIEIKKHADHEKDCPGT